MRRGVIAAFVATDIVLNGTHPDADVFLFLRVLTPGAMTRVRGIDLVFDPVVADNKGIGSEHLSFG